MTSTQIAKRESGIPERLETDQIKFIANTAFVPKDMRGKLPELMACIATGRELGIGDMHALRSISVIDGRPTISAELMVHLIRRAGHSVTGTFNEDKTACTVRGRRADNGDEMEFEWTMEMAKDAGLLSKKNWQQYAPSMLWCRAATQIGRMMFADVLSGVSHTYEELDEVGPSVREMNLTPAPTIDAEVTSDDVINEAQRTRLWTMAGAHNVPEPDLRRLVHRVTGQESTKLIRRDQYEEVCALVEAYAPLPAAGDHDIGTGEVAPDTPEASAAPAAESGDQAAFLIPESAKKPVTAP